MNITYVTKYDLYETGNYVGSFDTMDEVETCIMNRLKYTGLLSEFETHPNRIEMINRHTTYSIIESKRPVFSENKV